MRSYLSWLIEEGTPRLESGLSPMEAAKDLAAPGASPYERWSEGERLVANLTALARDLGQAPATDVVTLFGQMAELRATLA
jgi:hypothetical protein